MTDQTQTKPRGVLVRRLILGAAILFAIAAWAAVGVAYFMRPSFAVWAGLVTLGAISLEVLFWTAAGVFGWSFLAKRRAALDRWRQRLFGKRRDSDNANDAAS
jgi:hypothetical protein